MRLKARMNSRGVSLLEVLISMLILGFGVLGLAPLFVVSVEGNVIARDNTIVTNLVKEKIEYYESLDSLPSMPFTEYDQYVPGYPDGYDPQGETVSESTPGVYNRGVHISDHSIDSLIPDGLYQISVIVGWVDHQNLPRSTTYSTYIIEED